ncbi:MAG: hypothetical protein AAFN11_22155 [Chloroflexota bacterium]
MSSSIARVMQRIQQKWGQGAITTARHLQTNIHTIPTGFAALDALITGIPCGHITAIVGHPTSGLTTLTYHIIASAQKQGRHVVHIHQGTTFDAHYAMQCGVRMQGLLAVDVDNPVTGLDVTRAIVASRAVGLVVLNILGATDTLLDVRPFVRDLRSADCAVLCLVTPTTRTNATSLRLAVKRQKWTRQYGVVMGCLSSVSVQKNKLGASGHHALLLLPFPLETEWRVDP